MVTRPVALLFAVAAVSALDPSQGGPGPTHLPEATTRRAKLAKDSELVQLIVVGDDERVDGLLKKLSAESPYKLTMMLNDEDRKSGRTALYAAAERKLHKLMKTLLEYGADVDRKCGQQGSTPLILCSWRGDVDCVEILLNHGADPLLANDQGMDALKSAHMRDHTKIYDMLQNAEAGLIPDLRRGPKPAAMPKEEL